MTFRLWRLAPYILFLITITGCASVADRMGNAAERAINRQVDRRTDRAVTGAIDGAFNVGENAVRCAFNDEDCIRRAGDRGEDVVLVDRDGNYVDRNGRRVESGSADAVVRASGGGGPRPGVSNSGFDFTPGARALFQDDFESTRTGNVPGSIQFIKGEVEVDDDRGNKVLRALPSSIFGVPMGERPDLFTMEFDLFLGESGALCITTTPLDEYARLDRMDTCGQAEAWMDMTALQLVGTSRTYRTTSFTAPGGRGGTGDFGPYAPLNERYVKVRATVDGTYLKVYLDETRVVNIPNVDLDPGTDLFFFVEQSGNWDQTAMFDNLRVGAGGQETGYSTLATGGRVVARGLLFDSGSARLSASSESELTQIQAALDANPGLRIRIEGHTDASGAASTNMRLSQQRADAVRTWLVGRGISASRLDARGYGEDTPVASNETTSGREQNRRVESVGL